MLPAVKSLEFANFLLFYFISRWCPGRGAGAVLSFAAPYPPRPQYYHPPPRPAPSLVPVLQSNKTNKQFCTGAWGLDSQDEKCCVLGAGGLTEDQKQPQLAAHLIMGGKPIVMATARIFRSSQETMTPITRTWLQKRISGT